MKRLSSAGKRILVTYLIYESWSFKQAQSVIYAMYIPCVWKSMRVLRNKAKHTKCLVHGLFLC